MSLGPYAPQRFRITAFFREIHGKRIKKFKEFAYMVLGPYDSATRLAGSGSFYFPDLQTAKRYAASQFLDPRVFQVLIEGPQGQEITRLHRKRSR